MRHLAPDALAAVAAPAPNFVLARALFLRALAVLYAIAFASFGVQVRGLVGERGITPAAPMLDAARDRAGFWDWPTIFWWNASDAALVGTCWLGVALSAVVLVGLLPRWALLLQWLLYLSLVNVGGVFMSYQWDMLLLEVGLLSVFLAPGGLWPERSGGRAPARWAVALVWFLTFRLMVLSGLVKLLSGDPTWRDLSALRFHYWTQPLPAFTSYWADRLPPFLHELSAALMFAIEIAVPFLIFMGVRARRTAAALLAGLQFLILATGNYGFFNLLTASFSILLVDDGIWSRVLPHRVRAWLGRAAELAPETTRAQVLRWAGVVLGVVMFALATVDGAWSLARGARMPEALARVFDAIGPFRSINSYGLFAVMTTTRPEIIVEGSDDLQTWMPYAFRYKPGDVNRTPGFVAPHMPRLDWQMWFAALGSCQRNPWFIQFQERLLEGEPTVLALMAPSPFTDDPPTYVRSTVYQYRFASADERVRTGAFWTRTRQGPYCPVLTLQEGRLVAVQAPP